MHEQKSNDTCPSDLTLTDSRSLLTYSVIPFSVFVLVLGLVSVSVLFFQFFVLFPQGSVNRNFRLFFLSLNLGHLIDSFFYLLYILYGIVGVAHAGTSWVSENIRTTKWTCELFSIFPVYNRSMGVWIVLLSGIERLYFAIRNQHFDPPSVTLPGYGIMAWSLGFPVVTITGTFIGQDFDGSRCFCVQVLYQDQSVAKFLGQYTGLIIMSLCAFTSHSVAYCLSRRMAKDFHLSTHRHDLNRRFSVYNNVKLGKVLLWLVGVHMLKDTAFAGFQLLTHSNSRPPHELVILIRALNITGTFLQNIASVALQNTLHETYRRRSAKLLGIKPNQIGNMTVEANLMELDPKAANEILLGTWEGFEKNQPKTPFNPALDARREQRENGGPSSKGEKTQDGLETPV